MLKKRFLLSVLLTITALVFAGSAMAATTVSWLSPPDGSSYAAGTVVNPTGNANASGTQGGTGLDLMLVIDVSGSMSGSGLNAAKTAAKALIDSLPDNTTQVGIVKFNSSAGYVEMLQDLTTNKTTLKSSIDSLYAGGGTHIGNGIDLATAELTSSRAIAGHAKMQVVLSDGYSSGTPSVNAANAKAQGITVHSVGIPGHSTYQMQAIATAGGGVYTNVTNLADLENLFNGTGGNLVGLAKVDIQLADGSWIYDIATDGLGNFVLPDQVIALGANTFTAKAYGTDGTSATAVLTLNGIGGQVPEPATMALFGLGLLGFAGVARRKN